MVKEYITKAIVLDTKSTDLDILASLFTFNFGKIICHLKSARKITSKLKGHISSGNLVVARIILGRQGGFKLADVLKEKKLNLDFSDLYLLDKLLPELDPEKILYNKLENNEFNWSNILEILGWSPKESQCSICGSFNVFAFNIGSQSFFCQKCSLRFKKNELIYL